MQAQLVDLGFREFAVKSHLADDRMRLQVERELRRTGYRELLRVNVEACQGRITLSGRVSTYYLKQVAQCAAKSVFEVGEVVNDIEVTSSL
jgi:osmotically-inducible protein OsmY